MPMQMEKSIDVLVESVTLVSEPLEREVRVDFYLPTNIEDPSKMSLLLINDGQDLVAMGFDKILNLPLLSTIHISPFMRRYSLRRRSQK
jgi:hypothetical protein